MFEFMKLVGSRLNNHKSPPINRAKRFLRSLSAKSLDEAWSILAEDAAESWRGMDTGAMLEKAYRIKRKDSKEQQAVSLMLAIAKSRETEAVALVSREGMSFMQPQWMPNCFLAVEFASQWVLAEKIAASIASNQALLAGAGERGSRLSFSLPASVPGEAEDSGMGKSPNECDSLVSTALIVAVERQRSKVKIAPFLVEHGISLRGSGNFLLNRNGGQPVFVARRRGLERRPVNGISAEACMLSYACEGVNREDLLISLIKRFRDEGPDGAGWELLRSMTVLEKVVSWQRQDAAVALIGDDLPQAMAEGVEPADVALVLRRMIMADMDIAAERFAIAIASIGGDLLEALSLSNANVRNGPPALCLAIEKGKAELASLLIACGANYSVKAISQGDLESGIESPIPKSMLEMAAERGLERVIVAMLKKIGLGDESRAFLAGNDGARLAREALSRGFPEVAIALFRGGADLDSGGENPSSAMLWTDGSWRSQMVVIKLLREEPAAKRAWAFEALDGHGRGALARAIFGKAADGLIKEIILLGGDATVAERQLRGAKDEVERLRLLRSDALPGASLASSIESVAEKVRSKMRQALAHSALSTSKKSIPNAD